jgi:hypothetical protein
MIVGTKQKDKNDARSFEEQISAVKNFYGIKNQRLENLLSEHLQERVQILGGDVS